MDKKKKKNNKKIEGKNKKVLDGVNLAGKNFKNSNLNKKEKNNKNKKEIEKLISENEIIKNENDNLKNKHYNEKIQSFISILFTIIIFVALIMIIILVYNNYLKKDDNNNLDNIDKEKVCQEYIKKDYKINKEEVINFIKLNRGVFYSLDNFNNSNITNQDLNNFIMYYIWSSDTDYSECDDEDKNCLISKKTISLNDLKSVLKKYLNYTDDVIFTNTFNEADKIRFYLDGDQVVLTFDELVYQTYKHDFIDTIIDEDNIKVIIALSSKIDEENYKYIGYKTINLKYLDKKFIIHKIETFLNS